MFIALIILGGILNISLFFEKALFKKLNEKTENKIQLFVRNINSVNTYNSVGITRNFFNYLFEKIYGDNPWTIKCFTRSCLSTTIFVIVSLGVTYLIGFDYSFDDDQIVYSIATLYIAFFSALISNPTNLLLLALNIIIDFISLAETRYVLSDSERNKRNVILSLLLDFIFSGFIVVVGLSASYYIYHEIINNNQTTFYDYFTIFSGSDGKRQIAIPFFYSTFGTSFILYLFIIASVLFKSMKLDRRHNYFLSELFSNTKFPFTKFIGVLTVLLLTLSSILSSTDILETKIKSFNVTGKYIHNNNYYVSYDKKISYDDSYIAMAWDDGVLHNIDIINVNTKKLIHTINILQPIHKYYSKPKFEFTRNSDYLVYSFANKIYSFEISTGKINKIIDYDDNHTYRTSKIRNDFIILNDDSYHQINNERIRIGISEEVERKMSIMSDSYFPDLLERRSLCGYGIDLCSFIDMTSLKNVERKLNRFKLSNDKSLIALFSGEILYIYKSNEYFNGITSNPVLKLKPDEVNSNWIYDVQFVNSETLIVQSMNGFIVYDLTRGKKLSTFNRSWIAMGGVVDITVSSSGNTILLDTGITSEMPNTYTFYILKLDMEN